jgi:DNA-binding NarL/FixJ family response regulator
VVQGASNREISDKLVITEGTVKSHISNILNRLDARDRTQAAVIAVRHGLE